MQRAALAKRCFAEPGPVPCTPLFVTIPALRHTKKEGLRNPPLPMPALSHEARVKSPPIPARQPICLTPPDPSRAPGETLRGDDRPFARRGSPANRIVNL